MLLYQLCLYNPFTHAVELIRFALYGQVDWPSLGIVVACTAVFLGAAIFAYNPSKGLIARRGGPGFQLGAQSGIGRRQAGHPGQ